MQKQKKGNHTIETKFGRVSVGTRIRIRKVEDHSSSFADGIDYQARALNGREGTVSFIDSTGSLFGSWGGLAIIPDTDEFEIID